MSDESEPPALSLRPRKKPEDENSGPGEGKDAEKAPPKLSLKPKSAEKPAAAEASGDEKPRLSLKAKSPPAESPPEPSPPPATPQPRAKPKLSLTADSEPAATTPVESPAPEAPPAAEPAAPRLKPKLSVPPPETAEEKPVEPAPEAPPPPAETHRDETNPGIDPAVKEALKKAKSEKPRLKLTVSKGADPAPPAASAAPPAPAAAPQQSSGFVGDAPPPPPRGAAADPSLPPPLPVVTDGAANPATTPPLPPPAQLAGDNDEDEDDDSEAPARKRLRPEQRPIFKIAVLAVVVLLLGGIAAGGYMVYNVFFASPELNPYTAPLQAVSEPTPAETPASLAGQLIEKAQEAVDAHDEVVDATNEAAEVPVDPATAAETQQVTIDFSEGPVSPTSVQPSAAFQDWVNNVVISGVAETSNPRAFINGVLVKRGDTVDHGLGIVFDDIDGDENIVLFKDASGATVGKRY